MTTPTPYHLETSDSSGLVYLTTMDEVNAVIANQSPKRRTRGKGPEMLFPEERSDFTNASHDHPDNKRSRLLERVHVTEYPSGEITIQLTKEQAQVLRRALGKFSGPGPAWEATYKIYSALQKVGSDMEIEVSGNVHIN